MQFLTLWAIKVDNFLPNFWGSGWGWIFSINQFPTLLSKYFVNSLFSLFINNFIIIYGLDYFNWVKMNDWDPLRFLHCQFRLKALMINQLYLYQCQNHKTALCYFMFIEMYSGASWWNIPQKQKNLYKNGNIFSCCIKRCFLENWIKLSIINFLFRLSYVNPKKLFQKLQLFCDL